MNPTVHVRSFNFSQKITNGANEWLCGKTSGRYVILLGPYCKLAENYYFFDELLEGAFE